MFNKNYFALWILLAISLIVILVIAFSDDIHIGNYTVKKAPIADLLLKEGNAEYADSLATDSLRTVEEEHKVDSVPQSIFIFGDSMTFNLALRLAQYAKQNGHTIHSVNWDSSNTKIWADHDTLAYFLKLYKPTQIFISLGSNELYLKNPDVRRPEVKKILSVIDTIPYVWIGPPNWTEDSGINDMIASECKPGSFFRSAGMEFKRKADKVHPTRESSADWMDSIMRWIPQSSHPFVVDIPSDSIGKSNPNMVFLKALNK